MFNKPLIQYESFVLSMNMSVLVGAERENYMSLSAFCFSLCPTYWSQATELHGGRLRHFGMAGDTLQFWALNYCLN